MSFLEEHEFTIFSSLFLSRDQRSARSPNVLEIYSCYALCYLFLRGLYHKIFYFSLLEVPPVYDGILFLSAVLQHLVNHEETNCDYERKNKYCLAKPLYISSFCGIYNIQRVYLLIVFSIFLSSTWNIFLLLFIIIVGICISISVIFLFVQEVDPCGDISDQDIRIAIQNAAGPRTALFLPEVLS